jgi:hypothetical protein
MRVCNGGKIELDAHTFAVIFEFLDVKFVPLSVMMLHGTPKRNTIDLMKFMVAVESCIVTGVASIHLVNLSTTTRI